MSVKSKQIDDYNEFYSQADWSHPSISKGVARVELYFKMGALYNERLASRSLPVLDVGCGTGFYTHCLRLAGFEANGLDYSEVAIQKARQKWDNSIRFFQGDGNDLSQYAGQYDIIFARGLSLYNTSDCKIIGQLTNHYLSVLRPEGIVMVIVSTDLTGKNPGWVNYTYAQTQTLFSQVNGRVVGPIFFDYWLADFVLSLKLKTLARTLMSILNRQPTAQLLAFLARRLGARVPTLFLVESR